MSAGPEARCKLHLAFNKDCSFCAYVRRYRLDQGGESPYLDTRRQADSDAEAVRKYEESYAKALAQTREYQEIAKVAVAFVRKRKMPTTERLSPKVRAEITEMTNLLDRWKFAGAVLLSESIKLHNLTGCCRIEGLEEPHYCMGMNAIVQSVQRYIRETEAILDARSR